MIHFGEFLENPEVCGQTVLPDRSALTGQKKWKMPKLEKNLMRHFE